MGIDRVHVRLHVGAHVTERPSKAGLMRGAFQPSVRRISAHPGSTGIQEPLNYLLELFVTFLLLAPLDEVNRRGHGQRSDLGFF